MSSSNPENERNSLRNFVYAMFLCWLILVILWFSWTARSDLDSLGSDLASLQINNPKTNDSFVFTESEINAFNKGWPMVQTGNCDHFADFDFQLTNVNEAQVRYGGIVYQCDTHFFLSMSAPDEYGETCFYDSGRLLSFLTPQRKNELLNCFPGKFEATSDENP